MKSSAMLSYFLCGLVITTIGAVLPSIQAHYSLTYTNGGQLVFAGSAGFLLGVPLSALLLRRLHEKRVLTAAALLIGLSQLGMLTLPPFGWLIALNFVNSIGAAAIETVVATLMMEVFVRRRAVVMSHLEVAFGLGGLAMPLFASLLIANGVWRYSFLLTGILALLLALLWHRIAYSREGADHTGAGDAASPPPAGLTRRTKTVFVLLFSLLIFVYAGMEGSLNNFLPSLFLELMPLSPASASLSVGVFWSAMVLGRLVTGWIIRKVPYGAFLMGSMAGALAGLALLTLAGRPAVGYLLVVLLGLMMSGVYSITMVYANHTFPGLARFITSLITAVAGIGGAVSPALVGYLMDQTGPQSAIWLLVGFAAVFLAVLLLVFRLYRATTARQTANG
ncbi:hypothetical protein J31TS4_16880 [Paenibacillus sp. J31TS4]|uniref:MFS transporter n=1 Tax=Paenibacillus sp. J31TS4 TaxID=2807195 RepID=UPI001B112093|nr:MFS transporter [Paenibacillus sp. J31TS4]GIP38408.1 hypothetical protein J31TS4_16880 [Paenibacillus sp. J31TS4]